MASTHWRSPAGSWRLLFIFGVFMSPIYLIGLYFLALSGPMTNNQAWVVLGILPVNLILVTIIYLFPFRKRMRAARTILVKPCPTIGIEQAKERIRNALRETKLIYLESENTTGGNPPYYYEFLFSDRDRRLIIGAHHSDTGGTYLSIRWECREDEALARRTCEYIDREMQNDHLHRVSTE